MTSTDNRTLTNLPAASWMQQAAAVPGFGQR
jgi:hypothetical protein